MNKFKVGDRVKRTQNQHHGMKPGNIGTIIEIDYSGNDDSDFYLKEYNEGKGKHNCAIGGFELAEQTYTKLTPKVGDKFRVVKEFYRLNTGAELTIERLDENDYTLPCLSAEKGWVNHKYLTTEYLEPVEEERGYLIIDGGLRQTTEEFAAYSYTEAQGRRLGEGVVAGLLDAQKTLNKTKQTTMQKLTSALKRVLSADKQTLYKAGVIGQDLTLTGNGRVEYTSALFDNEGDHKKAVAQMVEDAQAYIDEEKN